MTRWLSAIALACFAAGCSFPFEDPDLQVRRLTEEDLKAPPGESEIRSAIVRDVRECRNLAARLEAGKVEVPAEIRLDELGFEAALVNDGRKLLRLVLKEDPPERLHAVTETAYWDREKTVYFYHYQGGNPHRDVWFGPLWVDMSRRSKSS